MRKLFVYFLWTLLFVTVIGVAGAFYAIDKGWIGYMPPIEDLQNPISRFATQIYSADGKIIGTWNYNRENRIMVDYSNLPTSLVQALIATEDARFYDHSGIDFIALGRAIVKRGLFGQKSAGGGSTITQQLAKQLYSEHASTTLRLPLMFILVRNLKISLCLKLLCLWDYVRTPRISTRFVIRSEVENVVMWCFSRW